jgi:hypothetical protein
MAPVPPPACHQAQAKVGPTLQIDGLTLVRSERIFGRVFSLFSRFRPQRLPLSGRSGVSSRIAPTYAATVVVGLAAHQAGRLDWIRSPKRVLAHTWQDL